MSAGGLLAFVMGRNAMDGPDDTATLLARAAGQASLICLAVALGIFAWAVVSKKKGKKTVLPRSFWLFLLCGIGLFVVTMAAGIVQKSMVR